MAHGAFFPCADAPQAMILKEVPSFSFMIKAPNAMRTDIAGGPNPEPDLKGARKPPVLRL